MREFGLYSKSDMIRFAYSCELLLVSFILSIADARHTVIISHNGEKTYLPHSPKVADLCMTPTCVTAAADLLTSLDESVDPCDDFYSFACGGWLKRQEVSENEEERNVFIETHNELKRKLIGLLESEYKSSDQPFVKKMKDYYHTCVDVDTLEKQGSEPLKKMLKRLGVGWPVVEGSQWDESSFDWVDTLLSFRKLGYDFNIMLDFYVFRHPKNETINAIALSHPTLRRLSEANLSLGLDDPKIAAYYKMMRKAAKLLGADESTAKTEMLEALHFEMALMKFIKEDEKIEDSRRVNVNTIAELQIESPQVPWLKLINGLLLTDQVDENEKLVNWIHDYMAKLDDLINSTDKRVIANYMLLHAVLQSTEFLSQEWDDIEDCEDEKKISIKGITEKIPRSDICLSWLIHYMQSALSSYYVREYFREESKNEAMIVVNYIHQEFLKILEKNDWMDEATREKAEQKAKAVKIYTGYPKELLNDTLMMEKYGNLNITTDSFLENMLAIWKWKTDQENVIFRKISDMEMQGVPYDDVIKVVAHYFPLINSITIPAGILHNAFFDKDRPNYMNFAGIGYIIGHEITHGFDNLGRYFDKDGKQVKWWDKVSDEHFLKKAKCIVDQYDNYTTFLGIKVNGEMTQNENIADNGGLKEAYLAYQSWTKDHGTEPLLPGMNYTQDQIFWLSAAHVFCSKYYPKKLREMLLADVHSPGKFRVIGPMSNLPEFSRDFKCSADAPMNRNYKCEVW